MCRFVAYSGEPVLLEDLLVRPEHSLVRQSSAAHDPEDRVNADGFGVGWYAPELSSRPGVLRSPQPAWSSEALRSIGGVVRSCLIFAHVRAASPGLEVSEQNCHPFAAESFLWMHNGTLGGHEAFKDWARRYLSSGSFSRIRGTTDSEYLFAFFLEQWEAAGRPVEPRALAEVLRGALHFIADLQRETDVREPSTLNIALTDGRTLIATRHALGRDVRQLSLHVAAGVRLVDRDRTLGLAAAAAGERAAVIVASEPLFPDPAWREVPPDTLVLGEPGGGVVEVPM